VVELPAFLAAAMIRWLGLLALATLVGSGVLDLAVLPRGRAELAAARHRLGRADALAALALLVATAGELLVRTRTMSGGDLAQAIAAVPLVLQRTHFGTIWIARCAALVLLLALAPARARPARLLALVLAVGVTLTTSLTGHAADWGDLSFTVLVDWSHVVAATAWTGGLVVLALAVLGERDEWPPALVGDIARRFSTLAGWCLLVVVVSGLYNSWVQVPALSALWTTTYGRALLLKVICVVVVAFLGAACRYSALPHLVAGRGRPGVAHRAFRLVRLALRGARHGARRSAPARLTALVGREALLVIVIFGATAVLGESTPKRHEAHHVADTEGSPRRMTMEALHASGGVPPGWAFTSPAGDAGRGREVFARLECFTCHAIRGAAFPRPSRPGPDLTGVGDHHPAGYLAESIMNPNAVIVEGRGYTGPDGRSIMPDYRDSLSVGDLIDLIAYLKSLGGSDR
jgi:putative copper resistance protein D